MAHVPKIGIWLLVCACAGGLAGYRWKAQDQSGNHHFSNFARAALDPIAPGSLLIVSTDFATNALRYVQAVEGYRPDVMILNQHLLAYPWHNRIVAKHFQRVVLPAGGFYNPGGYNMKQFLDANRDRFRVYSCNGFTRTWDTSPEAYHSSDWLYRNSACRHPTSPRSLIQSAESGFSFDPSPFAFWTRELGDSIVELYQQEGVFRRPTAYLMTGPANPILYEQIPEYWKNCEQNQMRHKTLENLGVP